MQITVGIKNSLAPGTKPSVHKSAGVRFVIVFVSPKYICSLDCDLAAVIGPEMIALRVHDADAQADANPHRAGLAVPRREGIRSHLMGRFGHSIGFPDGNAKQSLDLVNQL